jgi:hypothetical protein
MLLLGYYPLLLLLLLLSSSLLFHSLLQDIFYTSPGHITGYEPVIIDPILITIAVTNTLHSSHLKHLGTKLSIKY